MDGQFAQQLANLQQAASRAGRGGPNDRRSNTVDQSSSSGSGGRGGDTRRGNNHNRYDGHSRGDNYHHSRDGRNNGSSSSYHDYNNNDRHRNHSRSPRKRGRTDNNYYDGGSPRGREYGGRGHGRGGRGRSNHNGNSNDNRRNERNREEPNRNVEQEVPLAELVAKAAERHQASIDKHASSVTDGPKNEPRRRRHIALLFLTIADLPHEHIWKEWLKSSSANYSNDGKDDEKDDDSTPSEDVMVSVLCHAKYPERIQSPWLRQRHLLQKHGNNEDDAVEGSGSTPPKFHTRRPEWGSIEITRAMIDLLEEGLRIGSGAISCREDDDAGEKKNEDGGESGRCDTYRRYLATPANDAPSGNDGAGGGTAGLERTAPVGTDPDDIPPVDRFVFASESCLPVATLNEMEMALFGPRSVDSKNESEKAKQPQTTKDDDKTIASLYDKSWINARSNPNNGYAKQLQWDAIRPSDIPQNTIWKADQWMALTRTHGMAIVSIPSKHLEDRPLWPAFRKVRASDEMYFSTALSTLGILHRPKGGGEVTGESSTKNESCAGNRVRRRRITYCDWSVGAKNPASFTRREWKEVVEKARGEGCLLARKFVERSSSSARSMRGGKRKIGAANNDDGEGCGLVSVEDWGSIVGKRGS